MIWQLGGAQSPQHSDVEVPLHTILLEGEPAPLPKSDKSEKNKKISWNDDTAEGFPISKDHTLSLSILAGTWNGIILRSGVQPFFLN